MNHCLFCKKEIPSRNKYCDNHCQSEFRHQEWVKRWKEGKETGNRGEFLISIHLKRYLMDKYNYQCAKCGWKEKNPYTQKIPLEVEHIDGNFQNNNEDNLILLCPNCHSLTSTYKGANKGHGRKNRKKYSK